MLSIEYGVQSKRSLSDEEFTRTDDGRGWSTRNGKGYTLDEAREEAESLLGFATMRFPDDERAKHSARVVQRGVTSWEPLPEGPAPFTTDEEFTDEERVLYVLRASLHHLPNEEAQRHIARAILSALEEGKQ